MAQMGKNLPAIHAGDLHGFDSWVGKIPWRRKWLPTPVFLPVHGGFHGQRSLAGYHPWGLKESDMAEQLSTAQHSTEGLLRVIFERYKSEG